MSEIPCKDCIVFCMCKNKALAITIPYLFILYLQNECSIISTYCKSSDNVDGDRWWKSGEHELYELFTGKKSPILT